MLFEFSMQGQNNNFVAQIILAWPRLHFILLLYRKRGETNRGGHFMDVINEYTNVFFIVLLSTQD